jgi:hypothetical protein
LPNDPGSLTEFRARRNSAEEIAEEIDDGTSAMFFVYDEGV